MEWTPFKRAIGHYKVTVKGYNITEKAQEWSYSTNQADSVKMIQEYNKNTYAVLYLFKALCKC